MKSATISRSALLVLGNAKLGRSLVWSFSLPAGDTCPGKSAACSAACYAKSGNYNRYSVQQKYATNLARSKDPGFVGDILTELRKTAATVVRVHGSGDFYSPEYAEKWLDVVRRRRTTTFYFYTRSWMDSTIRPILAGMAIESNCHAWYSWDATMPIPPRDDGVRLAYMLDSGEIAGSTAAEADLVFRVNDDIPAKWLAGVMVCPYEQGLDQAAPITCERCRICFTNYKTRKKHGQVQ